MSRYLQQLARHAGLTPPAAGAPSRPPTDLAETPIPRDTAPSVAEASSSGFSPAPAIQPARNASTPWDAGPASPDPIRAPRREEHPAHVAPITPAPGDRPRPVAPAPAAPAAPETAAAIIQRVVDWIAEPERQRARAAAETGEASREETEPPAWRSGDSSLQEPPPAPAAAEIAVSRRSGAAVAALARGRGQTPPVSPDRGRDAGAPASAGNAPEYQVSIGSIQLSIEAPPPPAPAAPPPAPRLVAPPPLSTLPTRAYRHYLRPGL